MKMQDEIQTKGKRVRAPDGCAFERGGLVPVCQPAAPDSFTEICWLLVAAGANESFMEKVRLPLQEILDGSEDTYNIDSLEALNRFVEMITSEGSAKCVYQRLMVVAFKLGVLADCKSQRDLSKKLKVCDCRITQILRAMPSELRSLSRLRSRNAKTRVISERAN